MIQPLSPSLLPNAIAGRALSFALSLPAAADCHGDGDDRLALTVHDEEVRVLDAAALDALPQHSFVTTTQWTEGEVTFSGPALSDVLAVLDVDTAETPVTLVAANRYMVEISPHLIEEQVPIVATHLNGCRFGLRDLGPLWVVFPYDADPRYRTEDVYAASIWQLVEVQLGQ